MATLLTIPEENFVPEQKDLNLDLISEERIHISTATELDLDGYNLSKAVACLEKCLTEFGDTAYISTDYSCSDYYCSTCCSPSNPTWTIHYMREETDEEYIRRLKGLKKQKLAKEAVKLKREKAKQDKIKKDKKELARLLKKYGRPGEVIIEGPPPLR